MSEHRAAYQLALQQARLGIKQGGLGLTSNKMVAHCSGLVPQVVDQRPFQTPLHAVASSALGQQPGQLQLCPKQHGSCTPNA